MRSGELVRMTSVLQVATVPPEAYWAGSEPHSDRGAMSMCITSLVSFLSRRRTRSSGSVTLLSPGLASVQELDGLDQ